VGLGAFTLGNTRLAIQDPTPAGNQPFRSPDGRFVCVFNGEIYNYRELIDEFRLELANHCDGAIIPELWRRLGTDCLQRFRGMYSIAMVDTVASTLTLCRDPFGIKPLYIRRMSDGTIAFGSEVRPLACVDFLPKIRPEAVAQFLSLGALPADASPFEEIDAVPPNSVVSFDVKGRSTSSPIIPGAHPLIASAGEPDGDADVGAVLRTSVDLHLRADVPVVLLLSAGVDSTAIASAARQQGHDLHCMTVAGIGATDESSTAALSAAHYGHKHEVVQAEIGQNQLLEYFSAMQRPTIDGLNTFIVCRAVQASGHRVALSGLGGDEALGGYSHFRLLPLLGLLTAADRIPAVASAAVALGQRAFPRLGDPKVRRLLEKGGPRSAWGLGRLQREVYSRAEVLALTDIEPPAPEETADPSRSFEALVEAEVAMYMQSTLLPDADAFSMCSSVELRVPFVDPGFFSTAVNNRGTGWQTGKMSLARSLNDEYLLGLCRQPKRGFSVPMASWLSDGPLKLAIDDLGDAGAPVWDVVRRPMAERIALSNGGSRWAERWSLASLNQWLLTF
jgi:asparagine synthase (glutamine-hydrolysing)